MIKIHRGGSRLVYQKQHLTTNTFKSPFLDHFGLDMIRPMFN